MAKRTIILADDHQIFRQGLKSLIDKSQDWKIVAEAANGEELLKTLKERRCDIVITDLSMPEMDGLQAIKAIHKHHPKVKILVLTMLKDHEHFKCAVAAGANGYLLKDDAFDQLSNALHAVMRGKFYVSSSVAALEVDRIVRSAQKSDLPTLDILTEREVDVLKLLVQGMANKNIAHKLKISTRTVETHRLNLTNKTGLKSLTALVKYAMNKGLI